MRQAGIYIKDVFCGILTEDLKNAYRRLLAVRLGRLV